MSEHSTMIREYEALLRAGQSSMVRQAILRGLPRRLAREERFAIASLARRAGLLHVCIALLHRQVRPARPQMPLPMAQEKAEYAAALIRMGAVDEGMALLDEVNSDEAPQVHLYRVHGLFAQWRYADSIPILENYLSRPLDPYQRVIGQVNLASAYVHEFQHDSAVKLLSNLAKETERQGLWTLHGNTLERFAEDAIHRKDWKEAENHLGRAQKVLQAAAGWDLFFVQKWTHLMHFLQSPRERLADVETLRQEAIKRQEWETIRECDFYRATALGDSSLLCRVYFGTPFEAYRQRLLQEFGKPISLPDRYVLPLGEPRKQGRTLDLMGKAKNQGFKVGQLKHRLAMALLVDFYRPPTVVSLFSRLYPGEYFHPISGPTRVHQAMKTFRSWLKTQRLGVGVKERQGTYRFAPTGIGAWICVPSADWLQRNPIDGLDTVRAKAAERPFSVQEASFWLGIPRRTVCEIFANAVEHGLLFRQGKGRATRYLFLK